MIFRSETCGCSIWWGSIKYWAGFPSLSAIRKRTRWAEDITAGLSNRHEYRQTACIKLSIKNRDSGSTTAFSIQQRPNYQLKWYVNDASPRNTKKKKKLFPHPQCARHAWKQNTQAWTHLIWWLISSLSTVMPCDQPKSRAVGYFLTICA